MTAKEVYENIYKESRLIFIEQGNTEDKSSRMANKVAVQNTWNTYNDIKSCKGI